jgi:hypothetical protein
MNGESSVILTNLSIKEGCLFVLFVMLRSLESRHLLRAHAIVGKLSMSKGATRKFHNV